MTLTVRELIERLKEQEHPNLRFQRTNVVEVRRDSFGVKIITQEMQDANLDD